jgi:anti-anti-sigma regulatory factor
MTFRIETAARGRFAVFVLSGRIEIQAIAELRRLFELQPDSRDIVLDLKDVSVVDRDTLRFFADCEAEGAKLENCAAYIREWMEREKGGVNIE